MNRYQNLMALYLYHPQSFLKISAKSIHKFSSNMLTDRQTGHGSLPKFNSWLFVTSSIFPENFIESHSWLYFPQLFFPQAQTTSAHIHPLYQITALPPVLSSSLPHFSLSSTMSVHTYSSDTSSQKHWTSCSLPPFSVSHSAVGTTPSYNIFLPVTPRPPFFHHFLTVPADILVSPTLKLTSTSTPPSLPICDLKYLEWSTSSNMSPFKLTFSLPIHLLKTTHHLTLIHICFQLSFFTYPSKLLQRILQVSH